MRPQIDIAAYLPAAPGHWLLTLTHDDDKPVAHRSAVQGWALETGWLHPYPITVEHGLVVEDVAILRPDGAVETHAATFHENEQEWLEDAHAAYIAERARRERGKAASTKASSNKPHSPATLAIQKVLTDVCNAQEARAAAAAHKAVVGEVSL